MLPSIHQSTRVDDTQRPPAGGVSALLDEEDIALQASKAAPQVLVVGSIHMDMRTVVPALPAPGQTVVARTSERGLGGKGANQAVAAAACGADVALLGAVGDDGDGSAALERLGAYGVDTHLVARETGHTTGFALVAVDDEGENSIVVVPGADFTVDPTAIEDNAAAIAAARVVVTQGELAPATIDHLAVHTGAAGGCLLLNLAPVVDVAASTLAIADPLVVNEHEAADLTRDRLGSLADEPDGVAEAAALARALVDAQLARSVVITLGAHGAIALAGPASRHTTRGVVAATPAPAAAVVDTTGAGDACVGAMAAALAGGDGLEAALAAGVTAGTLAVGRAGASASYTGFGHVREAARAVQLDVIDTPSTRTEVTTA
jgi:ribokinase